MRQHTIFALIALLPACGGGPEVEEFVAFGSSTSTITLAWEPVAGSTGYTLERSPQGGGSYTAIATLDANAEAYFDEDLAAGTYTYRLTAVGTTKAALESETATSEDEAIRTTDDPPIGAMVQQIVGSTGGTLAMPNARAVIPIGALGDGTVVTLQPIASPTAGDSAIEIVADAAFMEPVTITFALTQDEAAAPSNVAIAVKQANGMWVTRPATFATDSVSVILPPEVAAGRVRRGGPPRDPRRVVKFQKMLVTPTHTTVKENTATVLHAVLRFSDEPCARDSAPWLCQFALYGFGYPEPIVQDKPIKNSQGEWKNEGPGNIFVMPKESSIIHLAPATKPDPTSWHVTFTLTKAKLSAAAYFIYDPCRVPNSNAVADVCEAPKLAGTIHSTDTQGAGLTITTDATVSFVWTEDIMGYVATGGTVNVTYDISTADCTTHGTGSTPILHNDGYISVVGGDYFSGGSSMVKITGTASCGGGAPEPFTLDESVIWWPSYNQAFQIKPDLSLSEDVPPMLLGQNTVASRWSLTPVP